MNFKVGDKVYHSTVAQHLVFTITQVDDQFYMGFRSDFPNRINAYSISWINKNFTKISPLEQLL